MPRRTNPILLAAALAVGLLLALVLAACGSSGSQSAETLDAPPLTVGTGATLPSGSSTSTTSTSTTSTTSTTDSSVATGGAVDPSAGTGAATGGGTAPSTGAGTGATGGATGGGTAPSTGTGAGTGTTTPAPAQPSNPGGAAPNYQSFCNENPGAC